MENKKYLIKIKTEFCVNPERPRNQDRVKWLLSICEENLKTFKIKKKNDLTIYSFEVVDDEILEYYEVLKLVLGHYDLSRFWINDKCVPGIIVYDIVESIVAKYKKMYLSKFNLKPKVAETEYEIHLEDIIKDIIDDDKNDINID